jgi:hypothetical protein
MPRCEGCWPRAATDRHEDELLGEANRGDELPEGLRSREGRLQP